MNIQLQKSYEAFSDEQLELLVLDWMTEELNITLEGAPLVLFMLDARTEDFSQKKLVFNRERLIEVSKKPETLVRAFELLDDAVPIFLAQYLPDIISSEDDTVSVNMFQLEKITDLEGKELSYFKIYLQENEILIRSEVHEWGEPYELWMLNPDFVIEYKKQWSGLEAFRKGDQDSIITQVIERYNFTREVAHRLSLYLDAGDFSGLSPAEGYSAAAEVLGVDESFIMDAERLIFSYHDGAQAPIIIEGRIILP